MSAIMKGGMKLFEEAVAELTERDVVDKVLSKEGVRNVFREMILDIGEPAVKAFIWNLIRQIAEAKLRELQSQERASRPLYGVVAN